MIIIPESQSQEKIDLLRVLGAEVGTVPAAPYRDPGNYVKVAGRVSRRPGGGRNEKRDLGQSVRQCG